MFTLSPKWSFSNKAFEAAVKKIDAECKLNRKFDIPFLAGYSKDGKTRYVDRSMPDKFVTAKGQKVDVMPYLLFHEGIEKCLIDYFGLDYDSAHEIAQHCEQEAVDINDINQKDYNVFMNRQIRRARDKDAFLVPPDLDLTPYKKYPDILAKMRTQ